MRATDKDVKRLRRRLCRLSRTKAGKVRWTPEREELIREIGQIFEGSRDLTREEFAKSLGISPPQMAYLLAKYRKLPRLRAKPSKPKLARVNILEDGPVLEAEGDRKGPVELVLENGMRVSLGSTEQVVELLEQLGRKPRTRLGAA